MDASTAEKTFEAPSQETTDPPLPSIFKAHQPPPLLITRGAEAILYKTHFLTLENPCALKYRPAKKWRHPALDLRLTRHRILSEARILVKCKREGVDVPAVWSLDWEGTDEQGGGWMIMEWIEGHTVRNALNQWLKHRETLTTANSESAESFEAIRDPRAIDMMRKTGKVLGQMHEVGVIHGDLTTSNLMLRSQACDLGQESISLEGEIAIIDFGLAAQSISDEDKAVDLYVLERAFGSTHPTVEALFSQLLEAYRESSKRAKIILKRLEEVRMRGRKRSMLG